MQTYGPRPLKSTRRHGPFWAYNIVTCDMDFFNIVTWDMAVSYDHLSNPTGQHDRFLRLTRDIGTPPQAPQTFWKGGLVISKCYLKRASRIRVDSYKVFLLVGSVGLGVGLLTWIPSVACLIKDTIIMHVTDHVDKPHVARQFRETLLRIKIHSSKCRQCQKSYIML